MEKWPASVDMVMRILVPQNTANFLTTEEVLFRAVG
jgi:hypothetical protein